MFYYENILGAADVTKVFFETHFFFFAKYLPEAICANLNDYLSKGKVDFFLNKI
jgi:hypothetical protein